MSPVNRQNDINATNEYGMSQLHIAVGQNNLRKVRILVEAGATFFPDKEGRWPSTIAAIMGVDDDLLDYVAEMEEQKIEINQ
jgi:uncharacterized protein